VVVEIYILYVSRGVCEVSECRCCF